MQELKFSDGDYWKNLAEDDMKKAFASKRNEGVAKNVIIFIGDGMGPNTVTAARIYGVGESGYLAFEKFPHIGAIKVLNTHTHTHTCK